eukprot:710708-Rhodomonas_salina.5
MGRTAYLAPMSLPAPPAPGGQFTPKMFDVWCRLLKEIPDAKLVVIQYKCAAPALPDTTHSASCVERCLSAKP